MARKTIATSYTPKPLSVEHVTLSPELTALLERLAEHVHDAWAAGRMADGWTWGPQRDGAAKRHPGLVPYAQLSEAEKEYDRATVRTALLGILANGFEIRRIDDGLAPRDKLK